MRTENWEQNKIMENYDVRFSFSLRAFILLEKKNDIKYINHKLGKSNFKVITVI